MRFLALFLIASTLAAQTPRLPPHLPPGYKPPPNAEWIDGKWACPINFRVPPNLPRIGETIRQTSGSKTKTIVITKDTKFPCLPPPQHPPFPTYADYEPHGIWDAPQSIFEFAYMEATGKLIWKHYRVFYAPITQRNLYCRVQNSTHPLPYYFDHDPKNLVLTRTSFEFDAVAGDSIAWRVFGR
jgi:hypothetical protein